MITFKNHPLKSITGILAVFVLALLQSPVYAQDEYQKYDIVVEINGMICPFCSYGLEKSLNKMKEIKQADVSLLDGVAKLILEENQKATKEQITKAVTDAGYETGKFIKVPGEASVDPSETSE